MPSVCQKKETHLTDFVIVDRRHEVADESFGLILPVEESPEASSPEQPTPEPAAPEPTDPEPEPELSLQAAPEIARESVPRSAPNTSAKRRPASSSTPRAPPPPPQPASDRTRSSARSKPSSQPSSSRARPNPYDIEPESPLLDREPRSASQPQITAEEPGDAGNATAAAAATLRPTSRGSVSSRLSSGGYNVAEEVTESPADAPGSGHRRRVRISQGLATQSVQLQRAVLLEEEKGHGGEMTTSSPLARKTRKSAATTRASTRSALAGSPDLGEDPTPASRRSDSTVASGSAGSSGSRRLSPRNLVPTDPVEPSVEPSSPIPQKESRRKAQAQAKAKKSKVTEEVPEEVLGVPQPKPKSKAKPKPKPKSKSISKSSEAIGEDAEEAEEVAIEEVARRIGRKRPRGSPPREEPSKPDVPEEEPEPPAKKRRQKRPQESPAQQSQPKASKAKGKTEARARRRRSDGEPIPIGVQRYTKPQRINEDDSEADILTSEIPFTNRGGVNVVDVLSQICEEVIEANLATLHEAASNAENTPMKKEYRTKLRALEAFQEELRTRLLEHVSFWSFSNYMQRRLISTDDCLGYNACA